MKSKMMIKRTRVLLGVAGYKVNVYTLSVFKKNLSELRCLQSAFRNIVYFKSRKVSELTKENL